MPISRCIAILVCLLGISELLLERISCTEDLVFTPAEAAFDGSKLNQVQHQRQSPGFEQQVLPSSLARDFQLIGGDVLIKLASKAKSPALNRTNGNVRVKRKTMLEYYPLTNKPSRWPNNTIPYELDGDIQNNTVIRTNILNAIDHWNLRTCIVFEPYNPKKHRKTHKAKLKFSTIESGCFSNIGYPDTTFEHSKDMAVSSVFLSSGCVVSYLDRSKGPTFSISASPNRLDITKLGQIIHELGHVIGFFHEQARADRDDYVEILWENIQNPSFNSINFDSGASQIEPDNLGVQYDISSIMHYQPTAFSKNFNKTIISRDRNLEFLMGNRAGLSFYDMKTANLAYKCSKDCAEPIDCKFDGFLNSKCECVCPEGITGKYCETFITKSIPSLPVTTLNLSCDFSKDFCGWRQEKHRDDIDWELNSGKSLLAESRGNSGPLSDRHGSKSNGSYLYFNTYFFNTNNESAILVSPLIDPEWSDNNSFCLSFWYHMFGTRASVLGQLSVHLVDDSRPDEFRTLWSRAGAQPQNQSDWLLARVNIKAEANFRLAFKAKRYHTYYGDIAIDDIEISNSSCGAQDTHRTEWSAWYYWSPCDSECGLGTTSRARVCQIGADYGDTDACENEQYQTNICYNAPCTESIITSTIPLPSTTIINASSESDATIAVIDASSTVTSVKTSLTATRTTSFNSDSTTIAVPETSTIVDDQEFSIQELLANSSSIAGNNHSEVFTKWTSCSLCDSLGYINRTRIVCEINQTNSSSNENFSCQVESIEKKLCFNSTECMKDGGWTEWSDWTKCTASCETTYKTRNRSCTNPKPLYGGKACIGAYSESQLCTEYTQNCSTSSPTAVAKIREMEIEQYTSWSEWSACSADCGFGIRVRKRKCKDSDNCRRPLDDLQLCRTKRNCTQVSLSNVTLKFHELTTQVAETANEPDKLTKLPGEYSQWSAWSQCFNSECNQIGYKIRKRICSSTLTVCSGNSSETKSCTSNRCNSELICTFDHPGEPFCNYTVSSSNPNYRLELSRYKAPNKFTGPSSDYPTKTGSYFLANGRGANLGDKAWLETGWLKSKSNGQCLTFMYSMYGTNMGSLDVKLLFNNTEHLIFRKSENQGNQWLKGYSYIPEGIIYKLKFESTKGFGNRSDIGLDYIIIRDAEECQISHCDFEKPDGCDSDNGENAMFWKRAQREYRHQGLGFFYNRLTRFSYSPEQQTFFKLPYYEFEQGQSVCLSFSYNLVGVDSHLNVYVIKDDFFKLLAWSSKHDSAIGSSSKYDSNWSRGYVDIFNNEGFQLFSTFQIIFEAFSDSNHKMPTGLLRQEPTVELDEINLSRTFCSAFRLNRPKAKKYIRAKRDIAKPETKAVDCGGNYDLSNETGHLSISSPNYPDLYPINTECSYLITTNKTKHVHIKVIDLEIESVKPYTCPDYLEIRYFAVGQTGLKLCGTTKKPVADQNRQFDSSLEFISEDNVALLKFSSDWTKRSRGFKLLLSSVDADSSRIKRFKHNTVSRGLNSIKTDDNESK